MIDSSSLRADGNSFNHFAARFTLLAVYDIVFLSMVLVCVCVKFAGFRLPAAIKKRGKLQKSSPHSNKQIGGLLAVSNETAVHELINTS